MFCGAKIMQTSGKRTRSQLPECSLSYAKILFIAFCAVTKKSAKISLFADSFNLEICMKKYQSRYSVGFMPRLCAT